MIWKRLLVFAALCLFVSPAFGDESSQLEPTPLSDDSDVFDIVRIADASLAPIGPGKVGRVGLWAHGRSFEEDALFFEEEDKAYAAWFEQHQIEQQRKKMDEIRARRESKRSSPKSAESTTNTAAAIKLRTTNRRRVLDGKSNLLHTKFKALQVDVRGAFKRFIRALGLANRTITSAEAQYGTILEGFLPTALYNYTDEHLKMTTAATTNDDVSTSKANAKKRSVGNATKSANATSILTPWATMVHSASGHLGGVLLNKMTNLHLRGSLPYPVLLDYDEMTIFELERSDLLDDARALDIQLARAEAGLHDSEAKLRVARLEKQREEDDESDESPTTEGRKKKEASALAENRKEIRRRQEERMSKYSEMRVLMTADIFEKIDFMQKAVQHHRRHYLGLIRSAAAVVPDELSALRLKKAELQRTMTLNDESTSKLRQEMKAMSKAQKQLQKSIAELEGIDKAANAIGRSARPKGLSFDIALSALEWNLRIRRGHRDSTDDLVSADGSSKFITQVFGLTRGELQDYVVVPLLASIIIAWGAQALSVLAAQLAGKSLRRLDTSIQRLTNLTAPKSRDEVAKFNWKLFTMTCLRALLRSAITLLMLSSRTLVPLLMPILCVMCFEGRVVRRDEFLGVTSAYSLMYRVNHLLAVHQKVAVYLALTLTSVVIYLASERAGAATHSSKPLVKGGRRLGRN